MHSANAKRKIDNARDILVGKVPNPQTQVEQITTALIYKFMDDMDERAKTLGGKARFFVGEYEKYSWRKLLDPRVGGQERMNLYAEAVQKLSLNPALPQIFRSIFKDAFVPYRDPETLSLFLKELDWFNYQHSEELGNAYEYLLSVLGSQGDAGQFRTPRHLIDFIVKAIDPKKDETVLDPACGTAGFLISAYNHILEANSGNNSSSKLNPDERIKLLKNFHGYDIDPGMVRLSLVNMYLHGFSAPSVEEYDSLTYEEHWEDSYDVILANPPFMTPKGGIRPHNRFQVKSPRAELLFLDYIIEHLKPTGRAGVIVPESVLGNNNAKYYAQLRKVILPKLVAIVNFDNFTFQPYAEVATSVLVIDNTLSRKTSSILFIDIDNDGFDKSSQKRPIDKNDLPEALLLIRNYEFSINSQTELEYKGNLNYRIIPREKIENHKDHSLLYKKYESIEINSQYETAPLSELITEEKQRAKAFNYPVWSVSNKMGFVSADEYFTKDIASKNRENYKVINPGYFAFNPSRINVGSIAHNNTKEIGIVSPMYTVFSVDSSKIMPEYLLKMIKSDTGIKIIKHSTQGSTRKVLKKEDLFSLQIPLPSLEKQIQIVKELYEVQASINALQAEIMSNKEIISQKISEVWGE